MHQNIELSSPFSVPREMCLSVFADLRQKHYGDAVITGMLIPIAVLADLRHIAHAARKKLFGNRRGDDSLRDEHTEA